MENKNIDWIIHNVIMNDSENKFIGNTHTHGLDKHGHRELCIVLSLDENVSGGLLNSMGAGIAFAGRRFTEGVRSDVLEGEYNAEILSLPEDPVLYVILPDENNKLPSDEGCQFPYNKQYEYAKLVSKANKM